MNITEQIVRLTVDGDETKAEVIGEVKHGKWINAKPMSGRVGKVCSACGNEAYWDSDYGQQLFDWCPYCGADMRKETEDAKQ